MARANDVRVGAHPAVGGRCGAVALAVGGLLQPGQAAEAKALFEQALEADPSSVGAHLGLGRALFALGGHARARIEFESALKFGNLRRDMQSQTEVYDRAAADYAAGRR